MHAYNVLVFTGPYSRQLGLTQRIKVSMESGKYARHIWAHIMTHAHKLRCMHTTCLHAQANISVKLGQIREIKVSMESEKHAPYMWAHNMTQAQKLACMHTNFLHARTHILAKLCQISKIKVSMESQDYFPNVWIYSRSCGGARGPMRRPKVSHKGPVPPINSLKKLERGAPQNF